MGLQRTASNSNSTPRFKVSKVGDSCDSGTTGRPVYKSILVCTWTITLDRIGSLGRGSVITGLGGLGGWGVGGWGY